MKQTALDWLLEQMSKEGMLPKLEDYHKAKQMESAQTISKMETIRKNGIVELSDEEIEEAWDKHDYYEVHIIRGAKWYRKQLKQRQ